MIKDNYIFVEQPFDIVLDKECNILILGSFPSVKSREYGFYYMNPQNRFWKMMGNIFDEDFVSKNNEEKRKLLLKNHIALYDVIISCKIIGSSDSSIKDAKILDIYGILKGANIKKILCNGSKAYELFIKYYPDLNDMAIRMPSTSPANAGTSLKELTKIWKDEFEI